jgi:hypothetical protein
VDIFDAGIQCHQSAPYLSACGNETLIVNDRILFYWIYSLPTIAEKSRIKVFIVIIILLNLLNIVRATSIISSYWLIDKLFRCFER